MKPHTAIMIVIVGLSALQPVLAMAAPAPVTPPIRIPTPSGEVILPSADEKEAYDDYGYAAVRRAGDLVFISGVVAGRRPGEGTDVTAFKVEVRRAFRRIETYLKAAGLGFDDVVMINSFHVWDGPNFSGSRDEQFKAFEAVKEEFMRGPKPAWTAVGVTSLLTAAGVVEIQMIAQSPRPK